MDSSAFRLSCIRSFSLVAIILLSAGANAQNPGAYHNAIGNASVSVADHWAVFNNPGALAQYHRNSIGFSGEILYGIGGLNTFSLASCIQVKNSGAIGFGISNMNLNSYFTYQKAGFCWSSQLTRNFTAGLGFYMIRKSFAEYGANSGIIADAGFLLRINKKTTFGVKISNPTAFYFKGPSRERIPTFISAGLAYEAASKAKIYFEAENSSYSRQIFKFGFDYKASDKLSFQAGIKTHPFENSIGIGYSTKHTLLRLALEFHPILGPNSCVSGDFFSNEIKGKN